MSTVALKIKIKTLAAESVFTKKEIQKNKLISNKKMVVDKKTNELRKESNSEFLERRKTLKQKLAQIYGHERAEKYIKRAESRVNELAYTKNVLIRKESRATQLAYAFLRGKEYLKTETIKVVGHYRQNYPDCCAITEIIAGYCEPESKYEEMNMIEILREVLKWAEMEDFDPLVVLKNFMINKGLDPVFIDAATNMSDTEQKQKEAVSS